MFDKIYLADLNKHDMYVKIMQFSSHCWLYTVRVIIGNILWSDITARPIEIQCHKQASRTTHSGLMNVTIPSSFIVPL